MSFEVRYPGYVQRVRQSLLDQPFMSAVLGAEACLIEPGRVDIQARVTPQMLQPHGNVHGIVASALADSAAGYAAQTLIAEDADVVTVEYKINYLSAGVGSVLRASGRVLRAGRTLSVCAADIYAEDDTTTTLFAHMTATMMSVPA